ncbi:hypothetical protein FTUN_4187 [Frigoriglobus tundricola]|uniref:Uncharacterized protein n=1 Tax=Frigoriglobus tundricola TaxID=2774151 RepID=A0A6M5YTB6_9BACT|nr:hypothetical protein FTUN_4187 [Frigoriglobus tundricola]
MQHTRLLEEPGAVISRHRLCSNRPVEAQFVPDFDFAT